MEMWKMGCLQRAPRESKAVTSSPHSKIVCSLMECGDVVTAFHPRGARSCLAHYVLTLCAGLILAGPALGQSGTVGPIAGYTSTNFTYTSLYTGVTQTNGGLVHVSATFNKPAGMELFGLKAVPTLPAGWTVDWDPGFQVGLYDFNLPSNAGSSPAGPFVTADPLWVPVSGKFLYGPGNLGLTVAAAIKLNFAVYVPPGESGDKEISLVWQYALSDGVDVDLPCSDNPQPVVDLNPTVTPPARPGTLIFGR